MRPLRKSIPERERENQGGSDMRQGFLNEAILMALIGRVDCALSDESCFCECILLSHV